jgi:hypothetical protein
MKGVQSPADARKGAFLLMKIMSRIETHQISVAVLDPCLFISGKRKRRQTVPVFICQDMRSCYRDQLQCGSVCCFISIV